MSEQLRVISIKEFAASRNIVSIAKTVRENVNEYPYVTFIDKDNVAENIYFSKKAAETVAAGNVIDKELMSKFMIAFCKNADDEERIKLVSLGERQDIADLFD